MKTKVISFFSDVDDRTYYSDHAKRLKEECEKLNIPYEIESKESLGDYQSNCLSKPQYILDKLNELQEPIIWLDVDSYLHKSLEVYDTLGEDVDGIFATANGMLSGVKASPLYFGNTDNSRKILQSWIDSTTAIKEENLPIFDHEPFFEIVAKYSSTAQLRFVGGEYCTWPGHTNENTIITMGLADSESKKECLREMGMNEELIEWQSPGDVK